MNQVTVHLPYGASVAVKIEANAVFPQRVTLAWDSASKTVTGAGENEQLLLAFELDTPSDGPDPKGYPVVVSISSIVNGREVPSNVAFGDCDILYYNVILVVSEDYLDNDWNDAVVSFTWWASPEVRRDDGPANG